MATQSSIDKMVKEAMGQLETYAYVEMHAYEKAHRGKLEQLVRAVVVEAVNLKDEFQGQPENIAARLSKHLSDDRIKLIKDGLNIPVVKLQIATKGEGHYLICTNKEGNQFLPELNLESVSDVDWATILHYADILVEAIILAVNAMGFSISPSAKTVDKAVQDTANVIKNSSAMQRAIEDFVREWDASESGATGSYEKAKALWHLLEASYTADIFKTVLKSVCSEMSWWEWAETSAKIIAMLVAALATDGAALIAKFALAIMSATDFAMKIAGIKKLAELKEAM